MNCFFAFSLPAHLKSEKVGIDYFEDENKKDYLEKSKIEFSHNYLQPLTK